MQGMCGGKQVPGERKGITPTPHTGEVETQGSHDIQRNARENRSDRKGTENEKPKESMTQKSKKENKSPKHRIMTKSIGYNCSHWLGI